MKTSDFSFELPNELIAQYPPKKRGDSRLLVLERSSGLITDSMIDALPDLIASGTVLVLNNTRVRKARLQGQSPKAPGTTEILLLKESEPGLWEVMISRAKKQKPGKVLRFPGGLVGTIVSGTGPTRLIRFTPIIDEVYLEEYGHVPLPPYIKRPSTAEDSDRYQTVYAQTIGSAAAPTAGLHFSDHLLQRLTDQGVISAPITLHVGMGTFLPIRTECIEQHSMHTEVYEIPEQSARCINRALEQNRPVLAVGTTVVRALESAVSGGKLVSGRGNTDLFITPGYQFKVVSQLLTNFHTPGSTLLVLVSAFAGKDRILAAYRRAVAMRYRFFSYGDAMLIQ